MHKYSRESVIHMMFPSICVSGYMQKRSQFIRADTIPLLWITGTWADPGSYIIISDWEKLLWISTTLSPECLAYSGCISFDRASANWSAAIRSLCIILLGIFVIIQCQTVSPARMKSEFGDPVCAVKVYCQLCLGNVLWSGQVGRRYVTCIVYVMTTCKAKSTRIGDGRMR